MNRKEKKQPKRVNKLFVKKIIKVIKLFLRTPGPESHVKPFNEMTRGLNLLMSPEGPPLFQRPAE